MFWNKSAMSVYGGSRYYRYTEMFWYIYFLSWRMYSTTSLRTWWRVKMESKRLLRWDVRCIMHVCKEVMVAGCCLMCEMTSPSPQAVSTPLLPHQKQALSWMCTRENKSSLPPFWEKRGDLYYNSLTCFYTKITPERVCGGILADDMGLVSTLGGLCCPVLINWSNTNLMPSLGKDSDHHCAHPHQLSRWKASACGDICKCSQVVL